jgi:hypothetical protein
MKSSFKFELGDVLKDVVTGYQGVAMARVQYFTGCNHYALLSQKVNDKQKPDDWVYFDERRLSQVGKKKVLFPGDKTKPTSGPGHNPPMV